MNKKAVFVTLASRSYLNQAKQVFAGAYFNGGWQGDYLLLAHDVPEKDLKWFRQKGILIKHCRPIFKKGIVYQSLAITSKLYLFTDYFKKWKSIIYCDADMIIRVSFDGLGTNSVAATEDIAHARLSTEVINFQQARKRKVNQVDYRYLKDGLDEKYNLKNRKFQAGMFVFDPKIIKKNTLKDIILIIKRYSAIVDNADQFALNLYFYQKWQRIPAFYNMCFYSQKNQWGLPNHQLKGNVHFCTHKPWVKGNAFYHEWQKNLKLAENMDLKIMSSVKDKPVLFYKTYLMYLFINEQKEQLKKSFVSLQDIVSNVYYMILHFVEEYFPKFFKLLKKVKAQIKLKLNY